MLTYRDVILQDIRGNDLIVDLHEGVVVARTRLMRWIDDWVSAGERPGAERLVCHGMF